MEEYLAYIVTDLDEVWTQWFLTNGFTEPFVSWDMVEPADGVLQSECRMEDGSYLQIAHDTPNAYYCPIDDWVDPTTGQVYSDQGKIWLPESTFRRVWEGVILGQPGGIYNTDFGAAIVTAHEFGHHIQDELRRQWGIADIVPPWKEIIADCFAGVWMAAAYGRGVLTDTDYDEAVKALEAIGVAPGGSHGTPDQRRTALLEGYHGIQGVSGPGDPATCWQKYWISG